MPKAEVLATITENQQYHAGDQLVNALYDLLHDTANEGVSLIFDESHSIELFREEGTIHLTLKRGELPSLSVRLERTEGILAGKLNDKNAGLEIALDQNWREIEHSAIIDITNAFDTSNRNSFRLDISGRGLLTDEDATGYQLTIDNNAIQNVCVQYKGATIYRYLPL